ncbi:hypothetical protein KCG48_00950 [Proteiniclasticum sp. BAD-10]|uniref:PepSY domain-containing protein n=1 Tax=Proteiniclasticum sediminis TaxID=2804028 RepID=A0A941CNG4_9CLOT|nr:hypothetical protein [Proteiniclasticum sediminis]MBR0574898.1 hypothetical protein [Proteiniclasticum sediminis]
MRIKTTALILLLVLLMTSGCMKKEDQTAVQTAPILSFSTDKAENIKFVRTKNYDGLALKEYTDTTYSYEVTPDGKLMTVYLRNAPSAITTVVAKKEEILLKAEDALKRLDFDLEEFETKVSFDETRKQYKSTSRQKKGEFFTGNNVYIQYTADGTLVSISMKYENPSVLDTVDKITLDKAKEIVMNYFATNTLTQKYAPLLTKELIRHEVDVYNNKKVYNLYFTLQSDDFGIFDFTYVVSTETGIILYRKELR